MKVGTLRKLLSESKKLNHVLASAAAMGLGDPETEQLAQDASAALNSSGYLELVFDNGNKIIRFPSIDVLIEFLKRAA